MNTIEALEVLKKCVDNNQLIEVYGDSGSGKSTLCAMLCREYEYSLYMDTVGGKKIVKDDFYYVRTNILDDIMDVYKDMDLIVIDDFYFLEGDSRKNVYTMQEMLYNNKKLSIVVVNQIRHNINGSRVGKGKYLPYANYLFEKYADKRFICEVDKEYIVTQIK